MAQTTSSAAAGETTREPYSVLVVDGNEEHQILSVAALSRKGWTVRTATVGRHGLDLALAHRFDAIVLGHKLRDMTGIELLRHLKERLPAVPKVFVVPPDAEEAALRAMESGAQCYIVKTPRYNELLPAMVEEQVQMARNRKRLEESREVQARVLTERKTVEEKLSQSQARLKMILEQAPAILWSTDTDLRVTSAIGAGLRSLNVDRTLPTGLSLYEYLNVREDDVEPIVSHRRALKGESVTTEIEWVGRIFDAHIEPLRSPEGAVIGTIGLAFDVTERKRYEESLRRSEERFQLLGRATNDVVWDWDLQTDGMWLNENASRVFGYAAEEVEPTGAWWEEHIHPEDRQRVASGLQQLIRSGETAWAVEYRFRRRDGTFATVVDRGYVLHDGDGRPVRMIGSLMDVTKERRAEGIQSAVYRISEATNSAKDLPELYRAIHKIIGGLMPATNFYIALYDDQRDELSFPYFVDEAEAPPPPQKLGRGLTEFVLRTGHPVLVSPEVFAELARKGEVVQVGPPSVDWVGAPLVSQGKTIGVIVVQSYTKGVRFGEEDKAVLNFVSEQVAMAIDRRRARETLLQKTSELEAIFRAVPDLYFRLRADGTILSFYAGRYADLFVPPESYLGRKLHEVLPANVAEPFARGTQKVLQTGRLASMEYTLDMPSGRKDFEARIVPLMNDQVVVIVRDITETKAAEEALRVAAERYRPLFDSNPLPMWVYDFETLRILAANEAAVRQYGYSQDELLSMTIKDIRPPEDVPALLDVVGKLREGMSQPGVWRHRRKDGSILWVEITSHSIEFEGRRAQLVLGHDVTEKRHAEAAMRASNEALLALFEASPLAIFTMDREGKVTSWNPAARAIFGWTAQEVVGRPVPTIPPGKEEETRGMRETVLGGGNLSGYETVRLRKDGSLVDVSVSSAPLRDAGGKIHGIMAVFQDVTERKAMERRLVESERLATMGSLAGFVAHELNTPLTSISLLSTAIGRRVTDAEVLEKLEKLNVERRRAAGIIRELLSLSKNREIAAMDTDLRSVVRSALEQVGARPKAGVRLEVELGEAPAIVQGDALQLQEVLVNLLNNAFDATARGSVTARIETRPGAYAIVVADTGSGMSKDVRSKLFQPFFSTKARGEGIGLGLLLSRHIVAAHGGTIEVASEPGKGSTFTVLIPRRDSHEDSGRR